MNNNILCDYTNVRGEIETAVTYLRWAEWFASDNVHFSLESTCRSKLEKTKTTNLKRSDYKSCRVSAGCKSCTAGGHAESLQITCPGITCPGNKRVEQTALSQLSSLPPGTSTLVNYIWAIFKTENIPSLTQK